MFVQSIKKVKKINKNILEFSLNSSLIFYRHTILSCVHALLIGLFRSDQVQIPSEMISSTEAEPTLTPSAARVTMPSRKYQLTERD